MANIICKVLQVLGLALVLSGIGVDYLLPGASPGVNLPQLLIIFAGLVISVVAFKLRRPEFRRRLVAISSRDAIAVAMVTTVTMLVLELLLTASGISVYFERDWGGVDHHNGYVSLCDDAGCRSRYDEVRHRCALEELSGRYCVINRQGYPDEKDFVVGADYVDRIRVLTLGDSFTHGFSAEAGKSFVETIESRHPEIVLWNAAFNATGTNQAVATFKSLAPKLEPHLTILGFFGNDFDDNLLPIQSRYEIVDRSGNLVYLRPFRFDVWDNLIPIDEATAVYFAAHGVYPPVNEIERLLGSTRLGTLLLRFRNEIAEMGAAERRLARSVQLTRGYLRELRQMADSQSSALLVMLIPTWVDRWSATSERYLTAVNLMEELELPYIDLTDVVPEASFAPKPDIHWNSAGHQMVGAILSECIQTFIVSLNLDDCKYVIIP